MIDDNLRAAIVAEIERQAAAEKAYYRPAEAEPPFGWDAAIDGPWRSDVVFYDGKIDIDALCGAIRTTLGAP